MPCCCLSAPQPPKKGWTHAGAAFTSTKPLVHMWGCEKVPLLFSWSRGLWLSLQHLGGPEPSPCSCGEESWFPSR